jgi:hypothetical protein
MSSGDLRGSNEGALGLRFKRMWFACCDGNRAFLGGFLLLSSALSFSFVCIVSHELASARQKPHQKDPFCTRSNMFVIY